MSPSGIVSLPSIDSAYNRSAAAVIAGRSNLSVARSSTIGSSAALRPRISNRLTRLVPTMFPTARPALPPRAAPIPTASSGTLVPIETTVSPIIIGLMPSHEARPVPARTITSAPTISATSPPTICSALIMGPPRTCGGSRALAAQQLRRFHEQEDRHRQPEHERPLACADPVDVEQLLHERCVQER